MKKMWKGLRRFFKRSDEKFTNVNLEDANIFKRILFYSAQQYKNDSRTYVCVCIYISYRDVYRQF